jgi:uncharacterized protein with PQ loop repeat
MLPRFLQRIFNNDDHHHFIDHLAVLNSGISAVALYPQLFSLMQSRNPSGLSPVSFFLIAINSCVWMAYGVHRHAPPLVVSSAANALAAFGILAFLMK